jgi:anti-sigma regulatory factor (Ser/Thr protein kinase)
MTVLGEFTVPRSDAGVRAARKQAQVFAEEAGANRSAVGDVALLSAEAITNAYLHGTGTIAVTIIDTGMCVRVEVHDGGPAMGSEHGRVDNGRGLALIDGFAADWEFRESPGETVTWFEVKK